MVDSLVEVLRGALRWTSAVWGSQGNFLPYFSHTHTHMVPLCLHRATGLCWGAARPAALGESIPQSHLTSPALPDFSGSTVLPILQMPGLDLDPAGVTWPSLFPTTDPLQMPPFSSSSSRCWFGKRPGVYTDYIYQGPMILVLLVCTWVGTGGGGGCVLPGSLYPKGGGAGMGLERKMEGGQGNLAQTRGTLLCIPRSTSSSYSTSSASS